MNENQEITETKTKSKKWKRIGIIFFAVFCGGAVASTAINEFGPASKAERVPLSSINLNFLFLALASFVIAVAAETVKLAFKLAAEVIVFKVVDTACETLFRAVGRHAGAACSKM